MKNIGIGLLVLSFFSCSKEEIPVAKHTVGDAKRITISVSQDYKYQVYFNLENGTEVSRNLKTEWDLGFFTNDERVFLNSSKVMLAAEVTGKSFEETRDTVGLVFQWDYPSLAADSLALKNWQTNMVYVVQLGVNEKAEDLGLRKIQFYKEENLIRITLANLDNSNRKEYRISKDERYHAVYVSFEKGNTLIEPPKSEWDVVITQYTHIFRDPFQSYLVLGMLLAPDVKAMKTDTLPFEDIKYDFAQVQGYTSQRDLIGYNWKEYSFDTQSYIVFSKQNYLILSKGRYYKLHFTDFYNQNGEKGNPTFEFQAL